MDIKKIAMQDMKNAGIDISFFKYDRIIRKNTTEKEEDETVKTEMNLEPGVTVTIISISI